MKKTLDDLLAHPPETPTTAMTPAPIFSPEKGFATADSPQETLDRVRMCKAIVDQNYLQMGCDLWRIKTKRWYINDKLGIETWRDYLDSINEDPKRAQRLIRVWSCLVQKAGIPMTKLLDIGYSKASLLATLVSGKAGNLLSSANADHWTDLARNSGYSYLEAKVKEEKDYALGITTDVTVTNSAEETSENESEESSEVEEGEDPTAAPESKKKPEVVVESPPEKMTFVLFRDQARDIEEALIHIGGEAKSEKPGHLLHTMALFYMAQNMGEKSVGEGRPKYLLNVFEKTFGGRVLWVKDSKQAQKMAEKHPDLFEDDDEDDHDDD